MKRVRIPYVFASVQKLSLFHLQQEIPYVNVFKHRRNSQKQKLHYKYGNTYLIQIPVSKETELYRTNDRQT